MSVRVARSTDDNNTPVRAVRTPSEYSELGSWVIRRPLTLLSACSLSSMGSTVSSGCFRRTSTSSVVLSVLSSTSISNASITPINKPIKKATAMMSDFLGLIGTVGVSEGSTTRATVLCKSPPTLVSLARFMNMSYIWRLESTSRSYTPSSNSLRLMFCTLPRAPASELSSIFSVLRARSYSLVMPPTTSSICRCRFSLADLASESACINLGCSRP